MDVHNVSEWKYKAEGNKHIVVYDGRGKVLRLFKLNSKSPHLEINEKKRSLLSALEKKSFCDEDNNEVDELKFLECVVLPLLNHCDACHIPKTVQMPELFMKDLEHQINSDRPKFRCHKSVDTAMPGLLMRDHCFIPVTKLHSFLLQSGVVVNPDVITVEIKLKKGYRPDASESTVGHPICQFCRTQIYRVMSEHRYKKCSFYCPLDLFSGDISRMKMALISLFSAPQNNFRLFKNGDLIFSQEVCDSISKKVCNEASHYSLKELLQPTFATAASNIGDVVEVFTDLLSRALLLPIAGKSFLPSSSQYCDGTYYKELLCKQKRNRISTSTDNHKKPQVKKLPATSILSAILTQQKLDVYSLCDVYDDYKVITSHQQSNKNVRDDIGTDAPYNSNGWKHITCKNLSLQVDNKSKDETFEAAHRLRRFLVAKSFNDCSVMVSVQRVVVSAKAQQIIEQIGNASPTAQFNVIKDLNGNYYFVSIAIVDTDPKPSSRIPDYYKQHTDIMAWWNKSTEEFHKATN